MTIANGASSRCSLRHYAFAGIRGDREMHNQRYRRILHNIMKQFRDSLVLLADPRKCARVNRRHGRKHGLTAFCWVDIRADHPKTEALETVVGRGGDSFSGVPPNPQG